MPSALTIFRPDSASNFLAQINVGAFQTDNQRDRDADLLGGFDNSGKRSRRTS